MWDVLYNCMLTSIDFNEAAGWAHKLLHTSVCSFWTRPSLLSRVVNTDSSPRDSCLVTVLFG